MAVLRLLFAGCVVLLFADGVMYTPPVATAQFLIEILQHEDGFVVHIDCADHPATPEEVEEAFGRYAFRVDPPAGLLGPDRFYGFSHNPVMFRAPSHAPAELCSDWAIRPPSWGCGNMILELAIPGQPTRSVHFDPMALMTIRPYVPGEVVRLQVGQAGDVLHCSLLVDNAAPEAFSLRVAGIAASDPVPGAWEGARRELADRLLGATADPNRHFERLLLAPHAEAGPPMWWCVFLCCEAVDVANGSKPCRSRLHIEPYSWQ